MNMILPLWLRPGEFGLAFVVLKDGGTALLAQRLDLTGLNFGSAREIQDYSCSIAADAITAG
ncbi:hypothetical protein [Burkholderia contaminans]|uniref:hypothetical protein n=1 Tax=Burkholderia contaminans TaxID=488447 RepID=UPI0014536780|nr:hypothetical protein [Burkholderia contaminans]VWC73718.1 hypothetical protein BCO18442_00729 [Burkholderia contaminans]